ncbi:cadherin-like beta sandwich domain-containing protein [Paenibacillus sp. RC67]|uniref:cadherin-like beta sandwich domain-containing protein n=1 Tax=Paenibacillus sp. RC67 TaxID=3039392 RepID=UPI0024AE3241|nr:cadherin-like beta sandwich domain-containing protein [Paenibacillus sp. RC67]
MKLKNRKMLSLLMVIVMVLTMIPFHPLEVKAATTPTLDLGNPVRVTKATYQLPNAAFGSTGVVHTAGGYFTVAVNSGSIAVGTLSNGITELVDGIKISTIVTDQSTPTNRVFNFSGRTTYEDIQDAIRNMTFTQVSGQTQSVTVNVTPGAPLTDGKTSVRIYNGRYFVYVARQNTMAFKDAVTTAASINGHLVEPAANNPGEMLAIASMFKEFKSFWSGSWYFISFIGATKTYSPNWDTSVGSFTRYVSTGYQTGLDTSNEIVPNGSYDHITLVLDTNNTKIGYLPVLNIHGSGTYKDPGVIVEYNPGVISNIITATKNIKLPVMGGSVSINGTSKVGQTLTANVTGITYTPNVTGNVPTYQWYRNGVAITNATGSSYALTANDLGGVITVTVTADGTHATGSVTSAATAPVMAGEPAVDKTQLQATVDQINRENLRTTDYTPASWQALQDALNNAKNVLGDPNATQKQVNDVLTALEAACTNLVKKEPVLTDLNLGVAEAVYGNPPAVSGRPVSLTPKFDGKTHLNYTATVMEDVYSVAIAPKADDENSTSKVIFNGQPVDAANWANLPLQQGLNVIEIVVTHTNGKQNTYRIEIMKPNKTVDKAALQKRADDINGEHLNPAAYTPESWQALQDELKQAEKVLSDPNATQAEIDTALEALNDARNRLVSANVGLVSLSVGDEKGNPIALTPAFDGRQLNYKAIVSHEVSTVGIDPQALQPDSKVAVTLNGNLVSASDWKNLPLKEGLNTIQVEVTGPDGKRSTYTMEIMRTTNKLVSLTPSIGSLSPAFDSNTGAYTMTVSNSVYQLQWMPVALDPGAKIEISVNGGAYSEVASGATSSSLPLNIGVNTVTVKVTDRDGHIKEYTITVNRVSSGSSHRPGSGSGSGSASNSGDIITTVNDNKSSFATQTTEPSGDRTVTTVKIDGDKLTGILSQGGAQNLAVRIPGDGDVQVQGLTAAMVKQMKDTGSSLEIGNLLAIYPVPSSQLDLGAIASQFSKTALGDIAVNIHIQRSKQALIDNARSRATANGYELLVNPVDLDLTFSHAGQTVRAEQLSGYAARYIALPEGIDPNRITTGVIVSPDGTVHHVPTVVTKISDRYFAKIQDLRSHGSYSVIWNPQDFNDVKSHWAHMTVNNVAARLILAGSGNNVFSPDRNITRSEFAIMSVTGMGLIGQEAAQNAFHDVTSTAWYRTGVSVASEFGIVEGYEDGMFRGEQQITREQGIAMVARAYNLIKPQSAAMSQTEIASALSVYGDAADLSDWAREIVARMIRAGIVEGSAGQLLKPQDNITRAEAAALIERMLKTTSLIDK